MDEIGFPSSFNTNGNINLSVQAQFINVLFSTISLASGKSFVRAIEEHGSVPKVFFACNGVKMEI